MKLEFTIVPVPASNKRKEQPVMVLATEISKKLGIPLVDCVRRKRNVPQLKNIYSHNERLKILKGLHIVDKACTKNKNVLLFDDLYRSGATLDSITQELSQQGSVRNVFALTITCTRKKAILDDI